MVAIRFALKVAMKGYYKGTITGVGVQQPGCMD